MPTLSKSEVATIAKAIGAALKAALTSANLGGGDATRNAAVAAAEAAALGVLRSIAPP